MVNTQSQHISCLPQALTIALQIHKRSHSPSLTTVRYNVEGNIEFGGEVCRSNTIKSRCHKPRVTLSRAACHTRAMSTLIGIRLSVKGYRKIVTQTWVQVTPTPIDRHHCTHRYSLRSQSMETSIET